MPILVVQGGTTKPVMRAYRRQGSVPKEILRALYVGRDLPTNTLVPVIFYDRYMDPPTGLRGVSATHNSGVLAWNAAPQAEGYQVIMRTGGGAFVGPSTETILPSPTTWTSELSLNVVGLAQNTTYRFTVRAHRTTVEGLELTSPESSEITLYTGYPAVTNTNPYYPGAWLNYIYPSRTDSWTPDYGWGGNSGGPDVIQGHPTTSNGTLHRGAVAYNTARQQLDAILGPYGLTAISSGVNIVDARIEKVHRRSQGGGTPNLYFYSARLDFSGQPVAASAVGTVAAPATNSDKYDLNPAGLVGWVRTWSQWNLYTPQNGMMIFRNDGGGNATNGYDGYCVLQNAVGDVWRLKVWLQWAITTPGASPTWSVTSA